MTYARWFDEGPPVSVLDAPVAVPAVCPPECRLGGYCGFCLDWSCPVHGVPEPGDSAEDTHLTNACVPVAHTLCHDSGCLDSDCWVG